MTATEAPNWEGVEGGAEHRTVGSHRAWCYQDAEWCYPRPDMYCWCCDQTAVPAPWRGFGTAAVLADLRRQIEAQNLAGGCDWVIDLIDTGGKP